RAHANETARRVVGVVLRRALPLRILSAVLARERPPRGRPAARAAPAPRGRARAGRSLRTGTALAPPRGSRLPHHGPRLLRPPAEARPRARHRAAVALREGRHAPAPSALERPLRCSGEPLRLLRLLPGSGRRRSHHRRVRPGAATRRIPRVARRQPRWRDGQLPRPRLVALRRWQDG